MRICIYGAGAIGGYMGVLLSRAGAEVSLVARGEHLEAMQRNGVKLRLDDDEHVAHPRCTNNPAELGPQDLVIIALKAHSIPAAVPALRPLLGNDTAILTAVNGIPYWYFYAHGGMWQDSIVESVDPSGVQWRMLGPDRAIGCVVYPATEVVAPGVIQHVYGNKLPIGEPDGTVSPRIRKIAEIMTAAGFETPIRERIRDEIWLKLWGNLSLNPISALTCATLDVICGDPGTREVARSMMLEAKAIGERLGVHFRVDVERRIDGAGRVGAHKTSMLQDLERNRALEIDALVTSVQELGRRVEIPTPTIDTVLALVRQRAKVAGLH
jgi:2-dehydropantoate 2-reductase